MKYRYTWKHIESFVFKGSLRLINSEAVYEKLKLYQSRLYKYNCSKISNIPYNVIFTTKFNDSSNLITIISCDYLNLSLANEYVGDVTILTQVIKYNQNFLHVDQPIRLQYSNQIKLYGIKLYPASLVMSLPANTILPIASAIRTNILPLL